MPSSPESKPIYLESLYLKNYGPISEMELEFKFYENGNPKPCILVGPNGAGKTLVLSHIINLLEQAKQLFYVDSNIKSGKVYKLRDPKYIKFGEKFFYSEVKLQQGISEEEMQLFYNKSDYPPTKVVDFGRNSIEQIFKDIPDQANSIIYASWNPKRKLALTTSEINRANECKNRTKNLIDNQTNLYFPSNRFEDPPWLNKFDQNQILNQSKKTLRSDYSSRNMICESTLKENMEWFLEFIDDSNKNILFQISEHFREGNPSITEKQINKDISLDPFIILAVKFIGKLLKVKGLVKLDSGPRAKREVVVFNEENEIISYLSHLSAGQAVLLNIFFSIIRDFDACTGMAVKSEDICGIVVIDEIDSHLHLRFQFDILPELLKLFPKVQFVITTHSPYFLLGMRENFGEENFQIIECPDGQQITTERFSEFKQAYETLANTETFEKHIETVLKTNSKPVVFCEGKTDIDYINQAAVLLNKMSLLAKITLVDGDGKDNLKKIWNRSSQLKQIISPEKKVVCLFDCDVFKKENEKNDQALNFFKRSINKIEDNPIKGGIENMFCFSTIARACDEKDIDLKRITGFAGEISDKDEIILIKDSKRNLCNWLNENGTSEDFSGFEIIFKILEEVLGKV